MEIVDVEECQPDPSVTTRKRTLWAKINNRTTYSYLFNIVISILLLTCLVLILYFFKEYLYAILVWVDEQDPWIIFLLFMGLFLIVSFPVTIGYLVLIITSGYLFGIVKGLGTVVVSANFGVAVAHWTLRALRARLPLDRLLKTDTARALLKVIAGPQAFKIVFFARLTPIPFGLQNTIFANTVFHATQHPGTKHDEDTIVKLIKGPIPGNTSRTWTVEVEVPSMDLYNVAACRYIDIDYLFVVKVSADGCHDDSKTSRRIVIGTIPLRGYQDNVPNPMQDRMPKILENYQNAAPHFGPVVNQPMPNVSPYPAPSPYPANSPYPGASSPYPGANPPYPGASSPYPGGNSPYPGANSPYPGANPPYPGAYPSPQPGANLPYPGGAQPVSPYPPPYSAVPSLPPGANVPYPTGPTNPFVKASAPGLGPATPDSSEKKNLLHDDANPPYNPNFKA